MILQKVAILDAGSQYGKLIDRRVRELCCYSDILPLDTSPSILKANYSAIIISGGPNTFQDKEAPKSDIGILDLDIPILGICYGMQWLGIAYGSKIEHGNIREDGQIDIKIDINNDLFSGLNEKEQVLLTHGDSVVDISEDLIVIGRSNHSISALKHKNKPYFGVQFHPEVDLTVNGKTILSNFLFKICKLTPNFVIEDRLIKAIEEIRAQVQDKDVVVLASGGVDSTVCCALLYKALGQKKVHAIHIDTGFMRMNEGKLVKESLDKIGFNLRIIDASNEFFNGQTVINEKLTPKLCETVHPEEKRKIIGDTFMKVIFKEIESLGLKQYFLAQGTLRPDLIESASIIASHKADVIKTHHNDTALVREKRKEGLIIEPLKDYHKDEVRQLGKKLGLPDELVYRQPFPGPGLAIRILCSEEAFITKEYESIKNGLKDIGLKYELETNLLPIKSVGVQGDGRTYSYVAAVNGRCDWKKLFEFAKEIPKVFHQINRIVFCFNEIKEKVYLTKTLLVKENIDLLKEADFVLNSELKNYENGIYLKRISQVPVVLIPISFENDNSHSIVIRTFITNDFMTGVPAIPGVDIPIDLIEIIVEKIKKIKGISSVFYDMTPKPPGTTEWE